MGENIPVNVWKHCILKCSLSITSNPPDPGTGDTRDVIACTPWKVPARTR